MVPFSDCACNVRGSYARFSNTNFHWTKMQTRSACTAPIRKTQISTWRPVNRTNCMWYNFPVVTRSHSGKRAVSFKKVNLPKLLVYLHTHITIPCRRCDTQFCLSICSRSVNVWSQGRLQLHVYAASIWGEIDNCSKNTSHVHNYCMKQCAQSGCALRRLFLSDCRQLDPNLSLDSHKATLS